MIRVFGHYVPGNLLLLIAAEAAIVWASVQIGPLLPYLGLAAVFPTAGTSALPVALTLTLLVVVSLDVTGLLDVHRQHRRGEILLRTAAAFMLAYLILAMIGYLVPTLRLNRLSYLLSFVTAFPPAVLVRVLYDHLTGSSRSRRKVLLVGSGQVSQLISKLATYETGYEVIGCIAAGSNGTAGHTNGAHPAHDVHALSGHAKSGNGVRVVGTVDEFAWAVKTMRPDVVVAAMEERRAALPIDTILECKLHGIAVEDWPSFYEKLTTRLLVSHVRPSWLAFSDGFRNSRIDDMLKRALDIAVSALGCLYTLPVVVVLGLLIKLDSRGPVFFRQERVGLGGRVFTLVKLRTMQADAEARTGPVWAQADDNRVTRIGRVLRTTRLDEIPQFFNVLRGDMSLVGPRPERPTFVVQLQEQIPYYMYRHVVKPGITGWAQVRYRYGASLDDARDKLEYDLYYVKNRSLFLDLLIIVQTIQVMLFGRGSR